MDNFILILDVIGAIAFAYSGVVVAVKHKMDLLGVILLGCITAVGGGVFRDIILGNFPVALFALPNWELIAAASTSLLLFVVFYFIKDMSFLDHKWFKTSVTIADAIGLGVFVVIGANVAIGKNANWFMVIFLATLTATGGGILRDLLALRMPVIFTRHIYAIAAILCAIIYYVMYINNVNLYLNTSISLIFVVIIRYFAYRFKINLPVVELNSKEVNKEDKLIN